MQTVVDELYEQFVAAVAGGRGASASAVRGGYGEGRVLTASRARSAGLVDRVATVTEVVALLQENKGRNAVMRGRRAETRTPRTIEPREIAAAVGRRLGATHG